MRSRMGEERLTGLVMLNVHREISVSVGKVIDRFAKSKQESRAVAREPRDAAAVVFGLQFADNIRYKF